MSTASSSPEPASYPRLGIPWPQLNLGLTYHDVVPISDSDATLIEFYSTKYENSAPPQGWLQRIRKGQITVDGVVVKDPNTILRAGLKLGYHRLPWEEPDAPYLLDILYEDKDIIALNKPSGLQVMSGGLYQQRTVLTQLQWWIGNHSTSLENRNSHPVPVHRLGRGTSGVLLCAKTKYAKSQLSAFFAEGSSFDGCRSGKVMGRRIKKIYRALVTGIICEDKVAINQPIGLTRYPGVVKGLYVASPSGKTALSEVDVLQRDVERNCTLVQVEIRSGRPHQIRIHLSYIEHPLLGDPLYASGGQPKCVNHQPVDDAMPEDGGYGKPLQAVPGDCGYMLHAHQLILSHPITSEELKITAPLPPALKTLAEAAQTKPGVSADLWKAEPLSHPFRRCQPGTF